MKYTISIESALPREKVVQPLADYAHLPKWLRGLTLHEPLSGVHGQVGTEPRVVMQTGKRRIELTETITRREPQAWRDPSGQRRSLRARDHRHGHVECRAWAPARGRSG